jgi:fumarate reductase subunit C
MFWLTEKDWWKDVAFYKNLMNIEVKKIFPHRMQKKEQSAENI